MSPKISIIIPILDDYDRLDACLDAICAQTYPLSEVEVLIVDNGTPAERIPELSKPGLEIVQLHESKPGSYCARNRALQVARGDLLVFTDSDCLPDPDWLEEGLEELARHKDGALVGGAIDVFVQNPAHPTLAEQWERQRAFPQEHYIRDLHFAATANAFTTRAVLDDVGPFQEKLKSGGDREMGERIHAAGYKLVFAPGARIKHPARHSLRELLTKVERTTRGDFRRVQLHDPRSRAKLFKEAGRAGRDLATLVPYGLKSYIVGKGDNTTRAQFALADTLVHATRRATVLKEAVGTLRQNH